MKALVIGGGGPTGPAIVRGLKNRGYHVSTLSRGVHPVDHGSDVEHIVGDPHFIETLRKALDGRTFDLVIASYGRMVAISEALEGRTSRFIAVGGFAAYRGWHHPEANFPAGLHMPTPESAPLVTDPDENRFASRIAAAEKAIFDRHPAATIFRYPYVYGPRQVSPREWSIVRRVLDGRRTMILTDGGRILTTHGYAENLAHAIMLAVDKPELAAGRAYNCGDEIQFDHRQILEIAGDALGVELDFVSIPDGPFHSSLSIFKTAQHRLMDLASIKTELGYRDIVPPAEAMRRTFLHYAENPIERGGKIEELMMDPFDYATEDRAIALARQFTDGLVALDTRIVPFVHPYAHPRKPGAERDQRGR